ncbi:MAG TPA: hypothetical protein VN229_08285, partial [Terriglobales bacterium]|nr:hypothetical protein [Terriglobales bacterium]
ATLGAKLARPNKAVKPKVTPMDRLTHAMTRLSPLLASGEDALPPALLMQRRCINRRSDGVMSSTG